MGELRLRIELPGMSAPDVEIWPADCSVGQMLPRLLAEAHDRDKAFRVEGHEWGLVLKRTNTPLLKENSLLSVGVVTGDTLVMRDELEVRAKKEQYLTFARHIVESGCLEADDITELARLAGVA